MKRWHQHSVALIWIGVATAVFLQADSVAGADEETQRQIRQLREQNESLQQQLRKQQEMIDALNRKVGGMAPDTAAKNDAEAAAGKTPGFSLGKVHISGEGAAGFFHSGDDGQFPEGEFRVDEAKLFVEAPIWRDIYFFSEVNIFIREEGSFNLRAGELYLDVENLSRLWKKDEQVNLRVGLMDIPFGEEYLTRDAIDNPLISRSIMDLWGVDEGVELYGSFGKFSYVVAVQNGSVNRLHDYNSDKAVVGRVSLDPNRWLHLSVSAMRTGDLDVMRDGFSELWLGAGLVRPLGGPSTTTFGAELLQGDVQMKLPQTTLKAYGGVLRYDDNDPAANNRRYVYYYTLEAQQKLYKGLYAAGRWSQVFAEEGFPISGNGNVDQFAFGPTLTEGLWQLSLGLGYRWNKQLVLKAEYTFERGHALGGARRDEEDMFSTVIAFAF